MKHGLALVVLLMALSQGIQAARVSPTSSATCLYKELTDPHKTFTLNAPTNQAFEALLYKFDMSERELLKDKKLLMQLLQYHVIPDVALRSDDIRDNSQFDTLLDNQTVTFHRESYFFFTKITIEGADYRASPAMIIFPDMFAAKTIIHIINKVILPEL